MRQRLRMRRLAVLTLVASAWLAQAQTLASSVQLRGVPFQAIQVITRDSTSGSNVTHGRIARDRSGSTYVEMVDPKTGVPTTAFLLDVPGHRATVLDLLHKRYRIRPASELTSREAIPMALPNLLEAADRSKGHSEMELRNGVACTMTHLGTKLIAGLLSVGTTESWPRRPDQLAPSHELERWLSVELGIYVRMTEFDRNQGRRTEVGLTEVVRTDPNPALFQIPPDFRAEQDSESPSNPSRPGEPADGD